MPMLINAIPFDTSALTTCFSGNEFNDSSACESIYMTGEDFVFEYTPTQDIDINIYLQQDTNWLGVFLLDNCPDDPNAQCLDLATFDPIANEIEIRGAGLTAGQTYYIVVSTFGNGTNCGQFGLRVERACGKDAFEPNNERTAAKEVPPMGVLHNAQICTRLDQDWFYFDIEDEIHTLVKLQGFTKDLDFELFDAFGTKIDSTYLNGDSTEFFIINNGTIGDRYFLHIFGKDTTDFQAEGYNIFVQRRNTPFINVTKTQEPNNISLHQNNETKLNAFPNPSKGSITIQYETNQETTVSMFIMNNLGQISQTIVDKQPRAKGKHQIKVEQMKLPQGTYWIVLKTQTGVQTLPIIIR